MINQVIWIWQYQEPEKNKCRKSRRQKSNQNNLGFLALPKHISLFPTTHSIFPSSSLNIFFLSIYQSVYLSIYSFMSQMNYRKTWPCFEKNKYTERNPLMFLLSWTPKSQCYKNIILHNKFFLNTTISDTFTINASNIPLWIR